MARARPLDQSAVAQADRLYKQKYGEDKIRREDPNFETKRKEWWAWYDDFLAQKQANATVSDSGSSAPSEEGSPTKSASEPVHCCPLVTNPDTCALVKLKAFCGHGSRSYTLDTDRDEHVIEVLAGNQEHNWDKISITTDVRQIGTCGSTDQFYTVTGPEKTETFAGPDAEIPVSWPGDLKNQWYKYFFPFAIDPVTYRVTSSLCPEESDTSLEILVYPDVEISITGKIDVFIDKKKKKKTREKDLEIEYKIGGAKVNIPGVYDKVEAFISAFRKTADAANTVTELAEAGGLGKFEMNWPAVTLKVGAKFEEDAKTHKVTPVGFFSFNGDPFIGANIEWDCIGSLIRALQAGTTATGVGAPVAALLHVLNFGRSKLGAGVYFKIDGNVKGEFGAKFTTGWKSEGLTKENKVGGDVVFTLSGRLAKEGSSFILKFLSHATVGGQGGFEWYVTGAGISRKEAYMIHEAAFTGLGIFLGKSDGPKTSRIADKGTIMLIEKKEFFKDERRTFWKND